MTVTLDALTKSFEDAMSVGAKYFGVAVQVPGIPTDFTEVIINRSENFRGKLAYYKNAYDENLVLISNPRIRIVNFTHGDDLGAIATHLVEA